MELVEELTPRVGTRQLRHTMVKGIDTKHYKILTLQLYPSEPPPEFHNFEVNVQRVDEDGTYKELIVPYFRRFYKKDEALEHHEKLLTKLDETLELEAPPAPKKPVTKKPPAPK
jgi:hypothetical protein